MIKSWHFTNKYYFYSKKADNYKIIKLDNKFIDVLQLSDNNICVLLKCHNVIWDVNAVKVFDIYMSKTFLSYLGLSYSDFEILQSLYNYNNVWYNVIKKNEDIINNIWQIIFNNFDVVFKKKYSNYKIIVSYTFLQIIVECFYSIGSYPLEEEGDGLVTRVSGQVTNYELINTGYKLFKKLNIILSLLDITIDKNTFEKNILYMVEILCLNGLMIKKISTSNNKSQVFLKLAQFDCQYDINFRISFGLSTCFEFENCIYKIERSIYSINSAVHAETPLQEKPILNLDALWVADCTEYKVDKEYLQITKRVINSRLSQVGRVWDDILKRTYLKKTLTRIKSINKQVVVLGYKNLGDIEYTKQTQYLKQKLQELAVQFSEDLKEFETISLIVYLEDVICNKSMYFIFFLDFRGRMYTISTYGPISNKIIRNILVYSDRTCVDHVQEDIEKSQTFKIIKDNYFKMLDQIKLKYNTDLFKSSLFWLLISLSSHFKGSLLNNNRVGIDVLLGVGIDVYLNKDGDYSDLTLDEEVELRRNILIINQLVSGIFNPNTFICKDSTASVFQHLFIYLQPKSIESLKICNIVGSNSWHDPYSVIINKFLENKIVDSFILSFFNRKTLKKSIMTHPYSVSYYSSWNYFKSELNKTLIKHNKTTFRRLGVEKQDCIRDLFKEFFAFLSKNFEVDIFYKERSTDIKNKINSVSFDDGTKINFNYLTLCNTRREIKNKKLNIRVSYNENYINTVVDTRQTELAIRANLIHATDSYFARLVILRFGCLTIHDCFCLKLSDINSCIDFMNNFFHKEIFKNKSAQGTIIKDTDVCKLPYSLTIIY